MIYNIQLPSASPATGPRSITRWLVPTKILYFGKGNALEFFKILRVNICIWLGNYSVFFWPFIFTAGFQCFLWKSTIWDANEAFWRGLGGSWGHFCFQEVQESQKERKIDFLDPPPGTQNFLFGVFGISLGAPWRPQGSKNRTFLYTFFVSLRRRQNHENVDIP